ncbi:RNA methyltransferase [Staphylothermus hellenicus]|uniref:tRNA/rRNA methyltransferase (SpoU) n=1 Tax=Staphylothermus hellenicus (strain DSM 12710 / JCM 10830 / BK20S6-10-b1 / P8) TaxID=591019 RepID=D7DAH2_STAHD|nr:RNA methyltransferase [Staphylothermus hellenicus]ADI31169.1 tRNA/rRNA methyltransferase (SpoU) [Staphylothermus hellenicus DSM 12710]
MYVRVVLVGVEGSVNLGFIARTCVNFSVDELYLVKPAADLGEALRYAAKARDYLKKAIIVDDLADAIRDVDLVVATTAKGYSVGDVVRQAVPLKDFADMIRGRVNRLAILFGRESTGLTRKELRYADVLVTIPANPEYPVLNLSQAVAVFLWEIWNIKGIRAENIPPPAEKEEIEFVLKLIHDISSKVLVKDEKVLRIMEIWKKIIYRSRISKYEARLLTYWLRKVLGRLE